MYIAYLFNRCTGQVVKVTKPDEKYAFMIRPDWEEITQEEYERINLAMRFILSRNFPQVDPLG